MNTIMIKSLFLISVILIAYLLKRIGICKTEDSRVVSKMIIYLTLPAALVSSFQNFSYVSDYLIIFLTAVVANAALVSFGLLLTRKKATPERALYCLQMSSYSIGTFSMPIAHLFFPAQSIVALAMFDLGNCPFNCGISYGIVSSFEHGHTFRIKNVLLQLLQSPPFMVYLIMILLSAVRWKLPDGVYEIAASIASANTVLAMFMIGLMFECKIPKCQRKQVFQIVGIRYGFNIALSAIVWLLPLPLLVRQAAILCLIAPIAAMSLVFSQKSGCEPSTCGMIHSMSLIVSLVLTFLVLILWNL